MALVTLGAFRKPLRYDSPHIRKLGLSLPAPGQIPRFMEFAPHTSTAGITAAAAHLVKIAHDHRKGAKNFA
jgi:hypothetical protein